MKALDMVDEANIINVYPEIDIKPKQIQIENGVWEISYNDLYFGRSPFRVLGTIEGKARYALASKPDDIDEITRILQTVYPELVRIEMPDDGYCDDSALPYDVPLKDFILNKKYVIISDGDEYCVWNNFKNTKLFSRANYPAEEI
jgi:hypothetical protein